MSPDVILISNGPGEVSTWVRPLVHQLRSELPEARITVALVPCPHSSGRERSTIESWNLGLRVWNPSDTVRYLLGGKRPQQEPLAELGVVIFLGGDQFFGVMLAQRTTYPLFVYTETTGRWAPWVDHFLASDRRCYLELRQRRISPRKIALVGNLMVDAVRPSYDPMQIREALGLSTESPVIGLLPGSKPVKVKYMTPLFLAAAERLWEADPALQFILHLSPFTPLSQIEEALTDPRLQAPTGGCGGRLVTHKGQTHILTPGGAQIRILGPEHHYAGMAVADVALTVPGTNTAELAILGVPMVVVLPLNKPEEIPLDGTLGRLGAIPLLGPMLKRALVRMLVGRLRYVALPNQRVGRRVTPELVGDVSPGMVADVAGALLRDDDRRRSVRLELYQAMGYPGAATAIVGLVRETLTQAARHLPRLSSPAHQEQQEPN